MDEWASLMAEYSSVGDLDQAVSDARKQLKQSQLQLQTTPQAEAAMQSRVSSLNAEVEQLRSLLHNVTETHNELKSHSKEQLKTIRSMRS